MYDYGSWLASGACRTELFALLLARKHTTPAIVSCGWCQIKYGSWLRILYLALTDRRAQVVKGGEAAPFMISPSAAISRSPGAGAMTCCERGHTKIGDHGVRQKTLCTKIQIAPMMLRMVQKRREYLLGSSDLVNYRIWTALTPNVMQGLNSDEMPALPSSLREFTSTYRFNDALEQDDQGFTPLMLLATSGNVTVLNELISQHKVNVDARLQMNLYEYGAQQGATALGLAAGMCPQNNVYAVFVALLAAGADPNIQNKQGTTPLMVAAAYQSLEGVCALLACGGDTLDLEKTLKANHATALSVAAFAGTTEIVDVLVQAGANRKHVEDGGGSKLTDACSNPAADARMLEVLCRPSDGGRSLRSNINDQMKARTAKFKLIDFIAQKAMQVQRRAVSLIVMGRAHCEGSTALHFSARAGNVELVQWLLRNGAQSSVFVKNRMGYRPIDLADLFGPHVEVMGLLGAAMVEAVQQQQSSQPTAGLSRKAMTKRLRTSELQAARTGQTAIEMLYPMWLMPVHEFMTQSELRPHQELVAAGKLVKWNATMEHVFFLSHQWTSFDRPDHSTAQLRTVQRTLMRMLSGTLPQTAAQFEDAVRLPPNSQISSTDWEAIVPYTHIWMDFISVRSPVYCGSSCWTQRFRAICALTRFPFPCVAGPAS